MRRNHSAQPGQMLLLAVVMLAVVFGLAGAFISYLSNVQKATNVFSARANARAAAMAGIDKAIWCLNQSNGANCGGTYGLNFAGETNVQVTTSTYYTTTITTVSSTDKTIAATGYYPSTSAPISKVTLKAEATITSTSASFVYGVQAGNGGFTLNNNAYVKGNIYANGNVIGSNGAYATGTVIVAGGTALAADQQETTNNGDYVFAQSSPVIDIGQSFKLSGSNFLNKISLYIKKTGNPSNVTVRILADNSGVPSTNVIASATLNASNVTGSYGWVDVSFSTPPALNGGTTYWLMVAGSVNALNYWTIGSDTNRGYGNGEGMYSANWNASPPVWTDAVRDYDFKIWTGGVITKIDTLHVYKDAKANTIANSTIDGDAYYQTLTSSTVGGTKHPGSPDPGPQDLPISAGQISDWKTQATSGGTISGDYNVSGSASLGPKEITGNLTFADNAILTLNGTIYVHGTIVASNNDTIQLAPGYGSGSGVIVADGAVTISNNSVFAGSGTPGSYVLVLTTNPSLDVSNPAMSLNNNSANSIFYASNGVVAISNNASLKEVTGFQISLSNNASVAYESGLANVSFSSGPGGSWVLQSGSTREVKP